MELLWHLLNLGNGWSSSVMRLTYKTLINIMVRWREGIGSGEMRQENGRRGEMEGERDWEGGRKGKKGGKRQRKK